MRKVRPRRIEEDATSQGGWLFADSFLALMVIFLATISFVPALGGGGAGTGNGNVGAIAGGNYVKGLNLSYASFDPVKIAQDIQSFIAQEKLSPNTTVLYAKIVGGFKKGSESENEGKYRALLFSAQITKAQMAFFQSAKVDLGASDLLTSNQIVLRLTLAPQ